MLSSDIAHQALCFKGGHSKNQTGRVIGFPSCRRSAGTFHDCGWGV